VPDDDRRYEERVLRIHQLLADDPILSGFTFVGCLISGPAVLVVQPGSTIIGCRFDTTDLEALLWEIPDSRSRVIGAIAVVDCYFERCTFKDIGFAGVVEQLNQFRQSLA
jgi:hypothetical protein